MVIHHGQCFHHILFGLRIWFGTIFSSTFEYKQIPLGCRQGWITKDVRSLVKLVVLRFWWDFIPLEVMWSEGGLLKHHWNSFEDLRCTCMALWFPIFKMSRWSSLNNITGLSIHGGLKILIFIFTLYLGKWSNLTNIFQMGWNHQLEFVFIFTLSTIMGSPLNHHFSGKWSLFIFSQPCSLKQPFGTKNPAEPRLISRIFDPRQTNHVGDCPDRTMFVYTTGKVQVAWVDNLLIYGTCSISWCWLAWWFETILWQWIPTPLFGEMIQNVDGWLLFTTWVV